MDGMATRSVPTRIRKGVKAHLYIDEWFEYRGLSDEKVAGRLGVDRTAVWKWRKQPNRLDPGKIARLASALDCEPADLWRLPSRPSLDAMIKDSPEDLQATAADIVRRLVGRS